MIVAEDSTDDQFFVLLSGRAQVQKRGQPLAQLSTGSHFGEMCLVDDAPRSASVRAETKCQVITFARDQLYPLLRKDPQLAIKLVWSLCYVLVNRLRNTTDELLDARVELEQMTSGELPFVAQVGD